ncbi:MAG: hypothetical protein QOF51_1702 [Chloroflexota bacterium]|jgi:hypothetical protein|nr:hypothetical protein [Chloroflexota bacterium]
MLRIPGLILAVSSIVMIASFLAPAVSTLAQTATTCDQRSVDQSITLGSSRIWVLWCHPIQFNAALGNGSESMSDGALGDWYMVEGRSGECLRIGMQSDRFPPQIQVYEDGPFAGELGFDWAATGQEVFYNVQMRRTEILYILATSNGAGQQVGAYQLRVVTGACAGA